MKNILIVEDELLLAMVNRQIVEKAGYKVLDSLTTGEEAVIYVKEKKPDLVLMDIFLAGNMDGVSAVEEIRKFSPVPVVFVTGNSDKSTRKRAESIERSYFIVKPVKPEELQKAVQNQLSAQ